jgi:hypothetical protein
MKRLITLLCITGVLTACGGGGSDMPRTGSVEAPPPQQSSVLGTWSDAAKLYKKLKSGERPDWLPNKPDSADHRHDHGTPPSPTEGKPTRAIADRPDDINGSQIHVFYALPYGGTDNGLDLSPDLENSVGSANNWLAGQTGGRRLRFDTASGRLDVTFIQLPRSDAEYESQGIFKRDAIEADLRNMGLLQPEKIYQVYYEGGNSRACADAPHPPELPGQVTVTYLRGEIPGAPTCASQPFASAPTAPPGYKEYSLLHEILHTLGAVDADAPDYVNGGHVGYDPADLMYAGPEPWMPSVLDVRKRNYYNPDGLPANVFNLATSSFLTP